MRGSIQKRTLKAMKDGKPAVQYYIVYELGMRWDEKKEKYVRRQKWERVPEEQNTKKKAQKLLTKRLAEIDRGEFIEPDTVTFREFKDIWVSKYAEGQVRPATMELYRSTFNRHLIPAFGDVEIAKIRVEDVQELKSKKLAEGLSPETVKKILRLLRQMLDHAVDWGRIRTNPTRKVSFPRIPRRETDFYSPEEIRLLLKKAPAKWYPFYLVAVTTGMRLGELLAMKWENLDWNQKQYSVKETFSQKRGPTARGFAETKTEGSAQTVDLTATCLRALEAHRKRQAEEKLKVGEKYQDLGLIFATGIGSGWNDKNVVNREFHPLLKEAGLRRIRFHDLRHTCASLLIAQGESPKYVQRQLRHASIQITFDRYGHLFPETNRKAMRRMDETLFGKPAKTTRGQAV